MKRGVLRRFIIGGLLSLALGIMGPMACGPDSTNSPPAPIPAPVSQLMSVGNPDGSGTVFVTGAPGATIPGAEIIGNNLSGEGLGKILKNFPIRLAMAGISITKNPALSNPDGSFQLSLEAQVGDTIQIKQFFQGSESSGTELRVSGNVIQFSSLPGGITRDGANGLAVTAPGEEGSPGEFYLLDLGGEDPPLSFPDPLLVFPDCLGIDEVVVDGNDGTGQVICRENGLFLHFSTESSFSAQSMPLTQPRHLRGLPEKDEGVIGQSSDKESVQIYNTVTGNLVCSFLIPHPFGGPLHVTTPLVEILDQSEDKDQSIVLALSHFDDGSLVLSSLVHNQCSNFQVIKQIFLPDDTLPVGMAGYAMGSRAIVTDAANDRILGVDLTERSVTLKPVGKNPQGVVVSNDQTKAFVVNRDDNSLTQVNLENFSTKTQEGVGLSPTEISLTSEPNLAAIISTFDLSLVLVDLDF